MTVGAASISFELSPEGFLHQSTDSSTSILGTYILPFVLLSVSG